MRRRYQQSQNGTNGGLLNGTTRTAENICDEANMAYDHKIWIAIFGFFALLALITHIEKHHFPEPKFINNTPLEEFCEERARHYLDGLNSMGPRTVGSYENEDLAVAFFLEELRNIQQRSNSVHSIEFEVMTVSGGSFSIDFIAQFSSFYQNVKNILAKIEPAGGSSNHSLLVNCHYDTVVDSPGASDDAVSCALMLESLRAMSQKGEPLKHSIIFNFNGAEENILQASHGFITQHRWAKDIRAFINLEGAGAGGKEIVFQIGPGNPWLIYAYGESVNHPHATVIGNELFQTGVIPGDTDFRIYRDYGQISGVDIAYTANGYIYHTKFDTPDFIPPGCIQRGGDNLLQMVIRLANSSHLSSSDPEDEEKVVYFDVLGVFLVAYPAHIGTYLNLATICLVICRVLVKIVLSPSDYPRLLALAVCSHVASWLITIATNVLIAGFMVVSGRSLSWYTNSWLITGLYICPAILAMFVLHDKFFRKFLLHTSPWKVEKVQFDATQIIWCVLLAVLTSADMATAYVMLLLVIFPLIIREWIPTAFNINLKDNPRTFLVIHLLSQLVPFIILFNPLYTAYQLFVPLMGRTGSEVFPDIPIGVIAALTVSLCLSYQIGLIYATNRCQSLIRCLAVIFTVSLFLAVFTPVGFPYNGNPKSPSPQRFLVHHISRTFHNKSGVTSDSGLWIIPMDFNAVSRLPSDIPGLSQAAPVTCIDKPYCGWPYYFPIVNMMKGSVYIHGPNPAQKPSFSLAAAKRQVLESGLERLTLSLQGASHINVYVRTVSGVTLKNWSPTGAGVPKPCKVPTDPTDTRDTYFMYYSYGSVPPKPWTFWLDFEVPKNHPLGKIVDIAFGSHYTHGQYKSTKYSEFMLSKFPNWTIPVQWSASYEAMEF